MKGYVYRVHVNPEPKDYPTKKEAFRQARNLATASRLPVLVTKEPAASQNGGLR